MEREGLDGLVAATLENFFYLSGIWNLGQELFPHDTQAYVVATREQPDAGLLAVSVGEADLTLEAYPTLRGAVTYGTFFRELPEGVELNADERRVWEITYDRAPRADPFEALCAALEDSGLSTGVIGVDERGPNRDLLDQLRARFPQLEVRPASQTFRQIRMVKTPAEHERLIGALRVTEYALRTTIASAREGITERELAHVFEQAIVERGARPGFTLLRYGRGMALGQVSSRRHAPPQGRLSVVRRGLHAERLPFGHRPDRELWRAVRETPEVLRRQQRRPEPRLRADDPAVPRAMSSTARSSASASSASRITAATTSATASASNITTCRS